MSILKDLNEMWNDPIIEENGEEATEGNVQIKSLDDPGAKDKIDRSLIGLFSRWFREKKQKGKKFLVQIPIGNSDEKFIGFITSVSEIAQLKKTLQVIDKNELDIYVLNKEIADIRDGEIGDTPELAATTSGEERAAAKKQQK
jgi:hypothetical protein